MVYNVTMDNNKDLSPDILVGDAFLQAFSSGGTDIARARQDLPFFIENVMLDQRGNPIQLKWFHREICKLLLMEKRVMILIPRSWGKCVSGDSLVSLASGQCKPMRDIAVGEFILSLNTETLKIEKSRIVAKALSGKKELFSVKTRTGRIIRASANHPLCVYESGKVTFKPISEMRAKVDRVAVLSHDDILWDEIDEITPSGTEETYDIQLDLHANFICDGIVAHNSFISCICYPLWRLGNNRDLRILVASNSESRSVQWLQEMEKVMLRNSKFQEVFGYMVPRARTLRWTEKEKVILGRSHFATHNSLMAVGMGSSILGARADIILADDIVGASEAYSPAERRRASEWLWTTLLPILEPDGQIVFTGSRWGPEDLYAEIIERWGGTDTPHLGPATWERNYEAAVEAKYPKYHELEKLEEQGLIDPTRIK